MGLFSNYNFGEKSDEGIRRTFTERQVRAKEGILVVNSSQQNEKGNHYCT